MDTNQKMTAEDFRLPPDPERIVNGLRDTGYNFNTAIADIVDNSISAKATVVNIDVTLDPELNVNVYISDNGCGMNMDGLKKDVYDKAAAYYEDYYNDFEKTHEVPFVDLGLAYIGFAQKYPHLFRLLFVSGQGADSRSMYDLVNGSNENVVKEINRAKAKGAGNAQQLFMQMWIFIHGAGCMAVTGDYDLDEASSVALLESAYKAFSIG